MHLCPGNVVAIGRAVVYYARLPAYLLQELNVGTVSYTTELMATFSHAPLVYIVQSRAVVKDSEQSVAMRKTARLSGQTLNISMSGQPLQSGNIMEDSVKIRAWVGVR